MDLFGGTRAQIAPFAHITRAATIQAEIEWLIPKSFRDSIMTVCTEYSASEEELAKLIYSITAVIYHFIKRINCV